MRAHFLPAAALAASLLASCGEEADPVITPTAGDPIVARALHDPLMVDPDLAYRNEANAALTIGFDHALPPIESTELAARMAREEARLILLENGPVRDLPDMLAGEAGPDLTEQRGDARAIAEAYDVPGRCVERLSDGYDWAARMPDMALVMPHGQVRQAAGTASDGCEVRVISYVSSAAAEHLLEWHYNLAERANLNIDLFAEPEGVMRAEKRGTNVVLHTSEGPNGLSSADLIFWVE